MRTPPAMVWLAWVAVVLVLPTDSLQQALKVGKRCPCEREEAKMLPTDDLPDDSFVQGRPARVSCCKNILLGYHDPGASIQWSFNGEPYSEKWGSSLRVRFCPDETIESTYGRATDQGTYNCTVTSSNNISKTVSMKMRMKKNIEHREKPMALKSSPDVMVRVGASVSFTCEGYVGANDSSEAGIYWVKYYFNHTAHDFASSLPNVSTREVYGSGGSWGMIKGELIISPVQDIHFGIYQCTIWNKYKREFLNMSLIDGVPEWQARELRYRTTVMIVAALLGLLALSVLVWCRWGRLIALCCYHRHASSDAYQYDVLLVHGESVGQWVWSVLMPSLEDSFGYTCFLPQRDMSGGEMVAESILEALSRCRRVVVVVTPCLLDSPWATWATYSGIQSALTSGARILALVHKENNFLNDPLEKNPLVNVLKVVRKIRVPEELVWDTWEGEAPLQHTSVPEKETGVYMTELEKDRQNTPLKLTIPDIMLNNSMSSSPRSQRLSNMITGSNAASKEDLGSEVKKMEVGGSVMFKEKDHELQDPGSPNSVTPFIIPSNYACRPNSDRLMCQPMGRCFQMICVGNMEQKFWQTLRLYLGPPSLSRRARSTS